MSVAVAVDAVGGIHVLRDIVPAIGHAISAWGVVDGQVKVVFDKVTGRKYYLRNGELRATRVSRRGLTWDETGLSGVLVRCLLRPSSIPLKVLPWQLSPDGATLQVNLNDDTASEDYKVTPPRNNFILRAVAQRLLRVSDNTSHRPTRTGQGLFRKLQVWRRPKWPSGTTVFSITYEKLPKIRVPPGFPPAPRESMGIIVGSRDGVELGRSQFKRIDDAAGRTMQDPAMEALLDDTFGPDLVAAGVADGGGKRVSPLVSLFVEPAERRNRVGDALFRAMLRESRACGNDYALLVHQDNGSGKLIRWYEGMGFKLLPEGNAIGVEDSMLARLPRDVNDAFYMETIRSACDVYDGMALK
jgi:GNAT superfamily N-acetyltransferase